MSSLHRMAKLLELGSAVVSRPVQKSIGMTGHRNPPQTHDHKTVNKSSCFPENTATTAMLLEKTPCYPANTVDKRWRKPTENPRSKTPLFSRKHCGDLKKRPVIVRIF